MKDYPAIHLLLKGRRWLPEAVALLLVIIGVDLSWRTGYFEWTVAGGVVGVALYAVTKSYLELLRLITEMLLPR